MRPLTPFSSLLESRRHVGGQLRFEIPPDWLQGRTAFGGLTAALAVQAMRDVAGSDRPLRALQTSFIGPVPEGPIELAVRVLREGRHMRQVAASVLARGAEACLLVGSFGNARESSLAAIAPTRPACRSAAQSLALPYREGLTPAFTQHIDLRWADGDLPFSGGHAPATRVHLQLKDESVDRELLTVLLADAAPPVALSHFAQPCAASSVTWALELMPELAHVAPEGWWRSDTEMLASAAGYANERATLWTPDGALGAVSYQVVAVFS